MRSRSLELGWAPITIMVLTLLFVVSLTPVIPTTQAAVEAEYFRSSPGRYNSIQAQDIDKDGNIEVIYGDYDGWVTVLEFTKGDFFFEWEYEVGGNRVWGLEVGDVTGDGNVEIVAGNGMGKIFVFEVKGHGDYNRIWSYQGDGRDAHGLLVHDFTGDGIEDIAVGTQYKNDDPNGMFYIMDSQNFISYYENLSAGNDPDEPEPVFMTKKTDSRWRGIDVGDPDGDGQEEVAVGCGSALGDIAGEGYLRVYDVNPENHSDPLKATPEWESEDLGGCVQGVAIVDIDNDDEPEIVCSVGYRYRDGWIYIFEYDGDGGWDEDYKSDNVGPKPFGFLVEDVDNDDVKEIITGNQPGYLYIIDGMTHGIEWKSNLLGTDVMGIAAIDLDEDPAMEIIAAQGGYQGKGDYTSGYTTPHIYVIDGETHEIEFTLGEKDYVKWSMQLILLALIIIFLVEIGALTKIIKTGRGKK
jgi:hypothetical protein